MSRTGGSSTEGRKQSKTLNNFVSIEKLREKIRLYGEDALRYVLLRATTFGADPDWSDADFNKSFNELANVVGNCLNRTLKMIGDYRGGLLPSPGESDSIDQHLVEQTAKLPEQLHNAYSRYELQQCALLPVELARAANGYIDATQPFKLKKEPAKSPRLDTIPQSIGAGDVSRASRSAADSAGKGQCGIETTGRVDRRQNAGRIAPS